jgi:hypothetical protein
MRGGRRLAAQGGSEGRGRMTRVLAYWALGF